MATPIGNLEDITLRALRVLREVDLVAAEDTRRTRSLLEAHGVRTALISYFEHNQARRGPELLRVEHLSRGFFAADPQEIGLAWRDLDATEAAEFEADSLAFAADSARNSGDLVAERFECVGSEPLREGAQVVRQAHLVELANELRTGDQPAEPQRGKTHLG